MADQVRRRKPGVYQIRLRPWERDMVLKLVAQLREQLVASTDEPHLRRLFPPAYADDADKDAGYQVLTRDELLENRLAAIDVVEATVDGGDVDHHQLTAWMTTLNSLRLVLGTRLDVEEELPDLDPDDPEAAAYFVYEYLGGLLALIVDALSRDVRRPESS
jgi:Domain of unknown function (DUF2017)